MSEHASSPRARRLTEFNPATIALVVLIQVICVGVFTYEILISVVGFQVEPISWQIHEFIEIAAAIGLLVGLIMGAQVLRQSAQRTRRAEDALRSASGAFMDVLEEKFGDWGLTPAERDVALFAIKGTSTQEIADLRNTAEGTVKAQTNAIYRKAGVTGRPQLLSLFIEDLLEVDA